MRTGPRLFIGIFPGGISYADRHRERHGDYVRLAFLPYRELVLQVQPDCPAHLRAEIEAHAATIIARRGEDFEVSTCGQTVRLGPDTADEYERAAEYCAAHGLTGFAWQPLPMTLSDFCRADIEADPQAFAARVRTYAYARAMAHAPEGE